MSYNVRDDAATFGTGASVALPNGAGAPTIANIQVIEPVNFYAQTAAGFAASTTYTLFLAPQSPTAASGLVNLGLQNRVVGVSHFYSTAAGAAATYTLEICPSGTNNGSGNAVLAGNSTALNVATTNANQPQTLNSNIDNLILAPGSRLNVIVGGTATTSLVDFTLIVYLIRSA